MKKILFTLLLLIISTDCILAQDNSNLIAYVKTFENTGNKVVITESNTFQINISPNPTKGLFKIHVGGLQEKENLEIEILNAQGQRIFIEKLGISGSEIEYSFDLIPMKSGVYTVKVSQKENLNIIKLIKE